VDRTESRMGASRVCVRRTKKVLSVLLRRMVCWQTSGMMFWKVFEAAKNVLGRDFGQGQWTGYIEEQPRDEVEA